MIQATYRDSDSKIQYGGIGSTLIRSIPKMATSSRLNNKTFRGLISKPNMTIASIRIQDYFPSRNVSQSWMVDVCYTPNNLGSV